MRGFQLIAATVALASLSACNLLAIGGSGEAESSGRNSVASNDREDRPAEKGADDSGERASRDRSGEEPSRNESRSDGRSTEAASSDQEWILGRWGDAGCATVLDFQSGGTFLINGAAGQWSLDGDTLTMSGASGEQVYTVTRESGGFNIEDAEGNVQELGRC
jgi:hypothetical protein